MSQNLRRSLLQAKWTCLFKSILRVVELVGLSYVGFDQQE